MILNVTCPDDAQYLATARRCHTGNGYYLAAPILAAMGNDSNDQGGHPLRREAANGKNHRLELITAHIRGTPSRAPAPAHAPAPVPAPTPAPAPTPTPASTPAHLHLHLHQHLELRSMTTSLYRWRNELEHENDSEAAQGNASTQVAGTNQKQHRWQDTSQ